MRVKLFALVQGFVDQQRAEWNTVTVRTVNYLIPARSLTSRKL